MELSLPPSQRKATFSLLYSELALHQAVLKIYTKPLFFRRNALIMSHDGRTLYDFARHTIPNIERLHAVLTRQEFHFREAIEITLNSKGKRRLVHLFPWEERIVDQLLFLMLNRFFHPLLSSHSYAYRYRGLGLDLCLHRIARAIQQRPRPLYFIKRDVTRYFPSVDHEIMLGLLEGWVDASDYLYQLVRERVKFRVRTAEGTRTAERGIPFGTPIACFLANLYLTPLDRAVTAIPGLAYYRYADDMLAFSSSREAALEAAKRLDAGLAELKLGSKGSQEENWMFTGDRAVEGVFASVPKFRHLGLEFRADGTVGLPRDKGRKIRRLFRVAFRDVTRELMTLPDPEQRIQRLIAVARHVLEQDTAFVAIIDFYLKHVSDEEQLRQIDRWLAEEVLARALRNGHRKANFRTFPFKQLRGWGLPSLRHRRRLLRHGRLKSSFFVFPKGWEEKRGRLPGRLTFSPRLEAAAFTIPRGNGGRL